MVQCKHWGSTVNPTTPNEGEGFCRFTVSGFQAGFGVYSLGLLGGMLLGCWGSGFWVVAQGLFGLKARVSNYSDARQVVFLMM